MSSSISFPSLPTSSFSTVCARALCMSFIHVPPTPNQPESQQHFSPRDEVQHLPPLLLHGAVGQLASCT